MSFFHITLLFSLVVSSFGGPSPSTYDCSTLYSIFAIDNSELGHDLLDYQIRLIDHFNAIAATSKKQSFFTVTSQSGEILTNDYVAPLSEDTNSLNKQVFNVLSQNVDVQNISFYPLLIDICGNVKVEATRNSVQNTVYITIIGSDIIDKENIRIVALNQLNRYLSDISLAIVLDKQYLQNATYMFGGEDRVFHFDINSDTKYDDVANWILKSSCSNSFPATTPTPPTNSPACQLTERICNAAFAIDASPDVLSKLDFEIEKNLVKKVLPETIPYLLRAAYFQYSYLSFNLNDFSTTISPKQLNYYINRLELSHGLNISRAIDYHLMLANEHLYYGSSFSAFIFLSQTPNPSDVQAAISEAEELHTYGPLNFILLNKNVDYKSLLPLKPDNYIYYDLNSNDTDVVAKFIQKTISCKLRVARCW
uniref:Secreted protein n=1 Tax=Parastrongyloides trichosuri TaxID=131310 RepID=A0A0N4ZJQ4_PARTI